MGQAALLHHYDDNVDLLYHCDVFPSLVCLVSLVSKETYFSEHLSVVTSKYSLCDIENSTYEFKLC